MGQRVSSTVLIVDDEEYIRAMAAHVLEEEGFAVLQAASTAEALTHASAGKVDVVLTDLNMPGPLDGLQLAAKIRETLPDVRVIVSSGDDATAIAGAERGTAFLPKPYRPHQLTELVIAQAALSRN